MRAAILILLLSIIPRLASAGPKTILHGATIIDGTGTDGFIGDIVVSGDRITALTRGTCHHPEGARFIDLSGKFVIPGLIDMHVHPLLHPWNESGEIEARYDRSASVKTFEMLLRFGITTARDPGAPTADALMFRRLLREGKIAGPALYTAGRILVSSSFSPEPFTVVKDEASIREEIRWQAAAGVDAIKIYSSMPPQLVAVAIEEAHRHRLPVLGHLQRTSWTEAARLGIDGLEHAAPWSVEYITAAERQAARSDLFGRVYWLNHLDDAAIDEMISELVKHDVTVDSTLIAMHSKFWGDASEYRSSPELKLVPEKIRKGWPGGSFTASWTPQQYADAKLAWPKLLVLTRKMFDAGVRLVAGTDTPTPWIIPGVSLHQELALFASAGIPPLQVLRIATSNAAVALRKTDELGSIREGLRADLVILTADPTKDIRHTRKIDFVMQGGRVIDAK